MHIPRLKEIVITLCSALVLGACSSYNISVNERVVLSPDPLYSDYAMADEALQQCIARHIERHGIRYAADLRDLNCSGEGISNLSGIATFHSLSALRLSNNQLSNIEPLLELKHLTELYLDKNRLRHVDTLRRMPELRFLDLSENPRLMCDGLPTSWQAHELDLPSHCR